METMETRKEKLKFEYHTPKIDDYVRWTRSTGLVDEGWVYFVDDNYITIEVGIKDKPNCQYTKEERHKKIHTLIVCHNWYWHEIEYIKSRNLSMEQ